LQGYHFDDEYTVFGVQSIHPKKRSIEHQNLIVGERNMLDQNRGYKFEVII